MMAPAPVSPEAAKLAISRAALMHRMRWLAPNSRRGRELAEEIRRLAREELKLEVARPLADAAPSDSAEQAPQEETARMPRLWWVERD